jgi:16S rRNA pseudouridine516 synthase
MLHKPPGCVSATRDPQHPTVLDLIHEPDKDDLHIAGRLDFNTTGLMLITNDGSWSRRLTQPQTKLPKVYYVETEQEIGPNTRSRLPRPLLRLRKPHHPTGAAGSAGPESGAPGIVEGRYHQVKRMFGHFNNKVCACTANPWARWSLDNALKPGEYRALRTEEIHLF